MKISIIINILASFHLAYAERLGSFEIDTLLIQPTMQAFEQKKGGFALAPSLIRMSWKSEEAFRGYLGLGTGHFRRPTVWEGSTTNEELKLSVSDAFAEINYDFFWMRLGLQPVPYGHNGIGGESNWLFPFSVLSETNWFPLRDFGFLIGATHNGYSTRLMAFNGESQANSDNESWLVGAWSYQDKKSLFGFSGLAAEITPVTGTVSAGSWVPVYVNGEKAKIRLLNVFLELRSQSVSAVAEFHKGDVIQESRKGLFDAWSVRADWSVIGSYRLSVQVENFDPDQGESDVSYRTTSLGVSHVAKSTDSRFGFVASRRSEAPTENLINDSLMFFIKIAPQVRGL